jgi:hypothetical protein
MCPVCLATTGLAGGVSAGAFTTFLATRLLPKRPGPTASTPSTKTEGDDHAATNDHIVIDGAGRCTDRNGEKQ